MSSSPKKKNSQISLLRVISSFTVLCWHVSSLFWDMKNVHSSKWLAVLLLRVATRWTNAVFIMISGSLFLDPSKPCSLKKLYQNRILRLLTHYLFWKTLYIIVRKVFWDHTKRSFPQLFFRQYWQTWFLPMMIGLNMLTPILRPLVLSQQLMEYYLAIWILFSILPANLPSTSVVTLFLKEASQYFPTTNVWAGYYVSGYYLSHHISSPRQWKTVMFLGIAGTLYIFFGSLFSVRYFHSDSDIYWSNKSLGTPFQAAAVFTLFVSRTRPLSRIESLVSSLECYTYGIFLTQVLFIESLWKVYHKWALNHMCMVICLGTPCIFVLSLLVTIILGRIRKHSLIL